VQRELNELNEVAIAVWRREKTALNTGLIRAILLEGKGDFSAGVKDTQSRKKRVGRGIKGPRCLTLQKGIITVN